HPPLILRVNRRHGSREAYLEELRAAGLAAEPCTFGADGIRLLQPCDVTTLPGFAEGRVSVQDEAAQLAADLLELAPGQRVLDACAAPGGKTCHLLEREAQLAEMIALDAEPQRLARVRENLDRLHLDAMLVAADGRDTAAWWDGKPFQRILLDAPCSATGVIRRHPDIKLTRQAEDISALARLQGELLDALWPTLEVGGILVYATCSVLPEENSANISAFLARTPGARELDIAGDFGLKQAHGRQLLPQPEGHDGFYYARLMKIAASPRLGAPAEQGQGIKAVKIIILGACQVGRTLAEHLASEANDITVVDTDGDRLRELSDRLDIRTIQGRGSFPTVLRQAGADDADM